LPQELDENDATGSVKSPFKQSTISCSREEVTRKSKAEPEIEAELTALEVRLRPKQFDNHEMPPPQELAGD
jgi:hypothetical protein